MMKTILILFLGLTYAMLSACTDGSINKNNNGKTNVITTSIIGSSKSPDPVLAKVRELEKKGILTNISVMESFPVQIKVTGPKSIITELQSMSQ